MNKIESISTRWHKDDLIPRLFADQLHIDLSKITNAFVVMRDSLHTMSKEIGAYMTRLHAREAPPSAPRVISITRLHQYPHASAHHELLRSIYRASGKRRPR